MTEEKTVILRVLFTSCGHTYSILPWDIIPFRDFSAVTKRLDHLKNIKGIGLFTGLSGIGKTYTIKSFIHSLNSSLYKVIYLQMTTISTGEFYKVLTYGLGLEPCYKKIDNYRQIQERIITLHKDQKVTLIIYIDEAQYLHKSILADSRSIKTAYCYQL